MSNFEKKYKKLLLKCLSNNVLTNNRTHTKTYKLFNESININLNEGFPILTSKKIFFEKALAEFKWMFKGRTDLKYLQDNNIKWWNDFANDNKELGKVYGHQIRNFGYEIDQIKYAIKEINNNSRRAIITLWNPCDLNDQALPCCFTQFNFVRINNKLNMTMTFRSSDLFLGLPYDIIVGALFLTTISNKCNLKADTLGINLADAHIYENHLNQVKEYCNNKIHNLPKLEGNYNNYALKNYFSENFIKAELIK
jgi:thymidylate synthase|tara:strand:- start:445 stop:1203 length:759 start_codon:yes stop_codon:yes gene_type:complete